MVLAVSLLSGDRYICLLLGEISGSTLQDAAPSAGRERSNPILLLLPAQCTVRGAGRLSLVCKLKTLRR